MGSIALYALGDRDVTVKPPAAMPRSFANFSNPVPYRSTGSEKFALIGAASALR